MKWLAALALGSVLNPALVVRDTNAVKREPLKVEKGGVNALFFVTQDCPVSNYYSHEIRRVCEEYANRGLSCALVYVDPTVTDGEINRHANEYGHGSYPRIVDRKHDLVRATGASVTPTVVLVGPDEKIAYRGRIDNFYAALGKPRRQVTQHDLRDALNAVFEGKPVPNPETQSVGCFIPDLKAYGK